LRVLFHVATDHGDQFVGAVPSLGIRKARFRDMMLDVIDDDFIEKAIHCPTNCGNEMQDLRALGIAFQAPLDGVHLASNPPDPG
jgi:hypothetical protein